jgi:hypothetical protein
MAAAAMAGPATGPATQPGELPHLRVDVGKRQVRMECEAVNAPSPLEFFVCAAGGAEHETVLRSRAKASHLHLALLMAGVEPGDPVRREREGKWLPPRGVLLKITCEFEKEGKKVSVPAQRMMRDLKSKKELPPIRWVFVGSKVMEDGRYAADVTGYLIPVVNFELAVLDVPQLRSSSNETLEWEVNPEVAPARESKVWLVIEPEK